MIDPEFPREDAAMPYEPEDGDDGLGPELSAALATAERTLLGKPGVTGVGLGQNDVGDDAIVVYVRTASARRGLPASIRGVPVVTEVTGEIEPLGG